MRTLSPKEISTFNSLYEEFFPILVKRANYFTQDQEVSTDLVQELFARMWKAMHKAYYKSPKGLLLTSFSNARVDYFRMRHVRKGPSLDQMMESEIGFQVPDTSSYLDDLKRKEYVEETIERSSLSLHQKKIARLILHEGLTAKEISRCLGYPNNIAVLVTRSRIVKRLREEFSYDF